MKDLLRGRAHVSLDPDLPRWTLSTKRCHKAKSKWMAAGDNKDGSTGGGSPCVSSINLQAFSKRPLLL